jgi:hypothetical protein
VVAGIVSVGAGVEIAVIGAVDRPMATAVVLDSRGGVIATVQAGGGAMVTVWAAGVLGQWQPAMATIPSAIITDPIEDPFAPYLFITTPLSHQFSPCSR